ncbi:Uncharacterised protein [Bordetella pertussis]|nr:Uncharacterised protein [Bordetella pertussis]CFP59905.1 Uncharacterised protein [Bordetella pertussis]
MPGNSVLEKVPRYRTRSCWSSPCSEAMGRPSKRNSLS